MEVEIRSSVKYTPNFRKSIVRENFEAVLPANIQMDATTWTKHKLDIVEVDRMTFTSLRKSISLFNATRLYIDDMEEDKIDVNPIKHFFVH